MSLHVLVAHPEIFVESICLVTGCPSRIEKIQIPKINDDRRRTASHAFSEAPYARFSEVESSDSPLST
jgi:hypothetical protein